MQIFVIAFLPESNVSNHFSNVGGQQYMINDVISTLVLVGAEDLCCPAPHLGWATCIRHLVIIDQTIGGQTS